VLPVLGLKAPVPQASTNGASPDGVKAPGAPGVLPAKAVAVPNAAERRK